MPRAKRHQRHMKKFKPYRRLSLPALLLFSIAFGGVGALALITSHAAPSPPFPLRSIGIFANPIDPGKYRSLEQLMLRHGEHFNPALVNGAYATPNYTYQQNWDSIANPWFVGPFQNSGFKLVVTADILPYGANFTAAARGDYDGYWRSQLTKLVQGGYSDAVLRVGHEMNCCYNGAWGAKDDKQGYINTYRHYVTLARSIPGQRFMFDWNPIFGSGNFPAEQAYPGDDVVDIIGLDTYDDGHFGSDPNIRWTNMMNADHGLLWHKNFAAAHGKYMSFPEWGVTIRPRSPVNTGGDNPTFIKNMHDWIGSNNVLYANYFDDDNSDYHTAFEYGEFPRSLAMFQSLNWAFSTTPPTPSDTSAPTVNVTLPAAHSTIAHTTNITAAANDDVGVTKVDFLVDTQVVGSTTTSPYSLSWDSTSVSDGTHNVQARAYDAAGNSATSPAIPVTVNNAPPPVSIPFRLNSGGSAYTDPAGNDWVADQFYQTSLSTPVGHAGGTYAVTNQISDTTLQPIFQTERWCMTGYSIPITNGTYRLNLDFAEINPASTAAAARIMNITAEGQALLTNFDIQAKVGTYHADVESFVVTVADGKLDLGFSDVDSKNCSKLSGLEILDADTPTPDTTAPTVTLSAPGAGVTLAGTTTLSATADDNVGVAKVEFYRGTTLLGTDTTAPYTSSWDTTSVANGSYSLTAKAYDATGNSTSTAATAVNVNNVTTPPADTTPPTVTLSGVTDGGRIHATRTLTAVASDNVGVTKVEFYQGNTKLGTVSTLPYTFAWDTTKVTNGSYTVTAKAYDAAGNVGTSPGITVTATNWLGDVNGDGIVNIFDLGILLNHYRQTASRPQGDVNGDGVINIFDLGTLLNNYGKM